MTFSINDPSLIMGTDEVVKDLVEKIETYENNCPFHTQTSTTQWTIRLEEGIRSPLLESAGKITVYEGFLKRTYMMTFFLVVFYARYLAKQSVSNEVIERIDYCKDAFYRWSADERNLKRMKKFKISKHVDMVFLNAIHFFINHEIGHTQYPGSGPNVEMQCDTCATIEFQRKLTYELNRLNNSTSGQNKINWQNLIGSNFEIIWQSIVGAIIGQIALAFWARVDLYGNRKEEKIGDDSESEMKYPLSYDRILNFLNCFNVFLNRQSAINQNMIDDCFAYMLMGVIFLYKKFNFENFLDYQYSYFSTSKQILELIRVFHEKKLAAFFSKPRFCPDEVIGVASNMGGVWQFERRANYIGLFLPTTELTRYYAGDDYGDPIVFVLESPHKSEFFNTGVKVYNSQLLTFTRPARGTTKRYFDENVEKVLNAINLPTSSKKHPVIILNACRFQCSLGEKITRKKLQREKMFKGMFQGNIDSFNSKSLEDRVNALNPFILINSCTKGYDPGYNMRNSVDFVLQRCHSIAFRKTFHPASWRNPLYRTLRTIP